MKALTKVIVTLTLGVGITSLLYIFAVSPLLGEVNVINAEVRKKKLELEVLQQQILAFKTAQSDLSKAARKDDVMNAVPKKEDLVVSVLDLERAATLTGTEQQLQIREPNPKDKKHVPILARKPGMEEIPYELSVTNDFTGIVNLLSYIEHLPHFTEIGKITLTSERLGSEQDTTGRSGKVSGLFNGVFIIKATK